MNEVESYEAIEDILNQYLKKHNHRRTPERYAILQRIYSFKGHFNAEILYNLLKPDFRVSLATVYNTLELLLDCRLIIKHQLGSQFAQYEKAFGNNTHHHLVCTDCGKIKEFTDKQIKIAIQTRQFTNFQLSHYSLYLFGLCSKCLAKQKVE